MRAALVSFVALFASACVHVVPLPPQAESHRAKTDDGWDISLTRYHPIGPAKGPPIVLCHGISANERNMDLDDEVSMARWFAAHGREAWTMSLRGTGASDWPDASAGRKGPIVFDDYWRHDLPAVIKYVQLVSNAKEIDYAGHSMGGMVLYAYLSQGGQGIHRAATLGSPTALNFGSSVESLAKAVGPMIPEGWLVPSHLGAAMAAPFQGAIDDGPFQRMFYTPGTTDLEAWKRLMAYGTAPTSGGTAAQLLELMTTGRFLSADKHTDLKADMAKITTPVMVIAGRLDRIAAAAAVKDGYRALGGPKRWLLITRANGAHGEYGHMDLVIGKYAGDDVWKPLLDFLSE
ncbi:MAG: alpha/beta fold hydrolase [Myxococcaceae bacterium]